MAGHGAGGEPKVRRSPFEDAPPNATAPAWSNGGLGIIHEALGLGTKSGKDKDGEHEGSYGGVGARSSATESVAAWHTPSASTSTKGTAASAHCVAGKEARGVVR
jgi:hypothetical protein